MIHKVLKAYLANKPKNHLSNDQWAYILSTILFAVMLIIFAIVDVDSIIMYSIELVFIVASLIGFSFFEKRINKKWRIDYNEYEKRIDVIRNILSQEMTYKTGDKDSNWYSEKKIEYLIDEGKQWIATQDERKKKSENFAHIAVLPVIAFVADILNDYLSSEKAIVVGFIALFIVLFGYCTDKLLSMIIDSIIKTASVDEMELLITLLKGLKARDFED